MRGIVRRMVTGKRTNSEAREDGENDSDASPCTVATSVLVSPSRTTNVKASRSLCYGEEKQMSWTRRDERRAHRMSAQ